MAQRTPPANESDHEVDAAAMAGAAMPDGFLRADDAVDAHTEIPFAAQHGHQLLLLDEEPRGWVMAELQFDPARCRYVEVRRATYDSPREAAGALLSRALPAGEQAVERTAEHLHRWIVTHHSAGPFDGHMA